MDKEYLLDYGERERAEGKIFARSARPKDDYAKRFKRLEEPLANFASFFSIWPQIPFCRTLVIQLVPSSAQHFSKYHGFGPSDVEKLTDFAKDTGRVIFTLDDMPEEYAGLDFLDPIFTELKPPLNLTIEKFRSSPEGQKEYRQGETEFNALSPIKYHDFLRGNQLFMDSMKELGSNATHDSELAYQRRVYASVAALGYSELKNTLADALVEDPFLALALLALAGHLIVSPSVDPFGATYSLNGEFLDRYRQFFRSRNYAGPLAAQVKERAYDCEFGTFLMEKFVPYPETYEACRIVCETVEQYDLLKVMNSLKQAARSEEFSNVERSSRDLSEILENIWKKSTRLRDYSTSARVGLTLGLGVVGVAVSLQLGSFYGGLLTTLLQGTLAITKEPSDVVGRAIMRLHSPSHMINIFAFSKRYKDELNANAKFKQLANLEP